jgi:predicted metal-binding membrane protein
LTCLALIEALSRVYLMYLAWRMSAIPTPGMAMPQCWLWGAVDILLMRAAMMVAMMAPSATPMILAFASTHRRQLQSKAVVPTTVFFARYVVM